MDDTFSRCNWRSSARAWLELSLLIFNGIIVYSFVSVTIIWSSQLLRLPLATCLDANDCYGTASWLLTNDGWYRKTFPTILFTAVSDGNATGFFFSGDMKYHDYRGVEEYNCQVLLRYERYSYYSFEFLRILDIKCKVYNRISWNYLRILRN